MDRKNERGISVHHGRKIQSDKRRGRKRIPKSARLLQKAMCKQSQGQSKIMEREKAGTETHKNKRLQTKRKNG